MGIHEKVNNIKKRSDFVLFVQELNKDYKENPDSWENKDLGAYLEALAAWVEDMDGYYLNQGKPIPEKPEWKTVADMLIAAKMYE
ncbi:MAG: hypothetical protein Q8L10_03255 [Candidatus Moranbacteria bacterium]|nr:hypothetical protein [Candidatus Moranbacteria bacterium]